MLRVVCDRTRVTCVCVCVRVCGSCRLDIALDLPPPAAVQRRLNPVPQPAYDMGPLIPPVHNPLDTNPQLQRDFLAAAGQPERPPTQGLRTINPLEGSLAAETVFIYPGGRQLPRTNAQPNSVTADAHARSDLPFKSLVMSPGRMGSMAESALHGTGGGVGMGGGEMGSPHGTHGPHSPGGALHGSSVMMSPARVQAALAASIESQQGVGGVGSVPIRHVNGDMLNTGPIPPPTAETVKQIKVRLSYL